MARRVTGDYISFGDDSLAGEGSLRRLLVLGFFILFALSAYPGEIHLKSGRVLYADDLPWVSGDVLKFHLEGQLAAVFLARVDLDKTRIGESPKRKPKRTAQPQASPGKAKVEKGKVYTNEDLEKLKKDTQMGDKSRSEVPGREPGAGSTAFAAEGDWLDFDSTSANANRSESLEEIQRQLEANQQDLDTGGGKFLRRGSTDHSRNNGVEKE